ncbi:P-loop containing nucleoside triphosphate hydrolase protein [Mycena alexandri]|uniref:P-loop containing nucleoside triphosphate hydrolase protein n=1 Tax=Mycena alexandri TaxID=1745969 RepID=A0AAD6SUK5_9AGAR|nr:P-loop containing nucleoside triphosphate hydrolase protein [Mycena alexandri]
MGCNCPLPHCVVFSGLAFALLRRDNNITATLHCNRASTRCRRTYSSSRIMRTNTRRRCRTRLSSLEKQRVANPKIGASPSRPSSSSASYPQAKKAPNSAPVPVSESVLNSFGNARTLFNLNASRFGKYTELQFSERGRLVRMKTLDYYLERNRASGAPNGEPNFHIFYYLVAGATSEERQHLHLLDKTTYWYLGQHRSTSAAPSNGGLRVQPADDSARFGRLAC